MTNTSFTLMWKHPEKDGGSKVIEYIVEIREANKKVWKTLGTTKSDTTNILVQNLTKGQGYHFRITARNKVGCSQSLNTDEKIIAGKQISMYYIVSIQVDF